MMRREAVPTFEFDESKNASYYLRFQPCVVRQVEEHVAFFFYLVPAELDKLQRLSYPAGT